jgi:hypothetical protein
MTGKHSITKASDEQLVFNLHAKGWTKRDAQRCVRIVRAEGVKAAAEAFGMPSTTLWPQLTNYRPTRSAYSTGKWLQNRAKKRKPAKESDTDARLAKLEEVVEKAVGVVGGLTAVLSADADDLDTDDAREWIREALLQSANG